MTLVFNILSEFIIKTNNTYGIFSKWGWNIYYIVFEDEWIISTFLQWLKGLSWNLFSSYGCCLFFFSVSIYSNIKMRRWLLLLATIFNCMEDMKSGFYWNYMPWAGMCYPEPFNSSVEGKNCSSSLPEGINSLLMRVQLSYWNQNLASVARIHLSWQSKK